MCHMKTVLQTILRAHPIFVESIIAISLCCIWLVVMSIHLIIHARVFVVIVVSPPHPHFIRAIFQNRQLCDADERLGRVQKHNL